MPQYTIKINTYDPVIIEAFARLRRSRKQAAFTQEALKHFIASDKGAQVIKLMSQETRPSPGTDSPPPLKAHHETQPPISSVTALHKPSLEPCSDVLEKILK